MVADRDLCKELSKLPRNDDLWVASNDGRDERDCSGPRPWDLGRLSPDTGRVGVASARNLAAVSSAESDAQDSPEMASSVDGGNRKIGRLEVARVLTVGEGGLEVMVPVDT